MMELIANIGKFMDLILSSNAKCQDNLTNKDFLNGGFCNICQLPEVRVCFYYCSYFLFFKVRR